MTLLRMGYIGGAEDSRGDRNVVGAAFGSKLILTHPQFLSPDRAITL